MDDEAQAQERTPLKADDLYRTLMSHADISVLPPDDAIAHMGRLIDVAHFLAREEGLLRAIEWGTQIELDELPDDEVPKYHYCLSNAWLDLREMRERGEADRWDWEQQEREQGLIHLRRALLALEDQGAIDPQIHCQILTNLANVYNTVGRSAMAIEYWSRALEISPDFAMARGNRGIGLKQYAEFDYDPGHQAMLLHFAHQDLEVALSGEPEAHARPGFQAAKENIEALFGPTGFAIMPDVHGFSLGDSEDEVRYRKWCLGERLFLNTLNDLDAVPIAACDVLHLPSIVAPLDQRIPAHHAFYNQIKQEFVSARYLLYEGLHSGQPHFSDRDVLLYNALHYESLSLTVEKLRFSFRSAYSLLDKTACFLNSYFGWGMASRRVNFRSVWYENGDRKKGLRRPLTQCANWPLRGLFWLSKDLIVADGSDYQAAIEPDASELASIRNHLEHKYLQVHEYSAAAFQPEDQEGDLECHVSRSEFEAKAVRLMRMARAALIYLSLAVHVEERRRAQERPADAVVPGIPLDTIEDDWKR